MHPPPYSSPGGWGAGSVPAHPSGAEGGETACLDEASPSSRPPPHLRHHRPAPPPGPSPSLPDSPPPAWGAGATPPWEDDEEDPGERGRGGAAEAYLLPPEEEKAGTRGATTTVPAALPLLFAPPPTHAWFPDPAPPRPGVTLAVTLGTGQLGAAWYDADCRAVRVTQAAAEAALPGCGGGASAAPPPPLALGLLLAAVRPARVLASAASDPRLLAGLSAGVAAMAEAAGGGASPRPTLSLERPALFTPAAAVQALQAVRLAGGPGAGPVSASSASSFAGWLGALCGGLGARPQQTAAAGALVAVLLRDGDRGEGGGEGATLGPGAASLHLASLAQASLPGALLVDPSSLRALQVFSEEAHPAAALGLGGRGKEGLSLAGLLLPRAAAQAGKACLRAWLARPAGDLDTIAARQASVAALVAAPVETLDALQAALCRARDPAACLKALLASGGRAGGPALARCLDSWAGLRSAAGVLVNLFEEEAEEGGGGLAACPALARLVAAVESGGGGVEGSGGMTGEASGDTGPAGPTIPAARAYLASIFEPASLDPAAGAGPVSAGIMPALDAARGAYAALPGDLDAAVGGELARVPPAWAPAIAGTTWAAVYLPQVGFMVRVEGAAEGAAEGAPAASGRRRRRRGGAGGGGGAPLPPAWALPPGLLASVLPDYEPAYAPAGCDADDGERAAGYVRTQATTNGPAASSAALTVGGGRAGRGRTPPAPRAAHPAHPPPVAFYRCDATRALDARHGDILHAIGDMEAAILDAAGRAVAADAGAALEEAAAAVAEVGACAALAAAARELGWSRPEVVEEPVLAITGGRHPLAEAVLSLGWADGAAGAGPARSPFIPNDTRMGVADPGAPPSSSSPPLSPRVHAITGPNGSGKTVYARQVGLIIHLAHMGSFVPAASAVVGLADRLCVVCGGGGGASEASSSASTAAVLLGGPLASHHGAFAADLARLAGVLASAGPASVVIADEVGAGTLAADGAGLVCATLAALGRAGGGGPRTLATTHYSEVLDGRYLAAARDGVACWTLSALAPRQGEGVAAQPLFLRRLVATGGGGGGGGLPAFGLACAAAAGLSAVVVERAGEVMRCAAAGREGHPLAPLPAAAEAAAAARSRPLALATALAGLEEWEGGGGGGGDEGLPVLSEAAKALLLAAVR